jgi:hypothetical protein
MLSFSAALFTLSGCGSGGGGNTTPALPKAVVTLSTQVTQGTIASKQIHGIQATLILPAGVTVKADSTGKTGDKVVVASGDAADAVLQVGNYTPATGSTKGTVKIEIVKTSGFDPGNFVTVTCDLATGISPKAEEFQVTDFKAVECQDVQSCGTTIDNLSVSITSEIK